MNIKNIESNEKRFVFELDDYDDVFFVSRIDGEEELGRPYRFELVLNTKESKISVRDILGKYAKLVINANTDYPVTYKGIVSDVEQLHQANQYFFYRVVIVPNLWNLSLNISSAFYANKGWDASSVIHEILGRNIDGYRNRIINFKELEPSCKYPQRRYWLKYKESDLDFLQRLMEQEGIYYYFSLDGEAQSECICLVDSVDKIDSKNTININYVPHGCYATDERSVAKKNENIIQKFEQHIHSLPRLVRLSAYNYRMAAVPLKGEHEVDPSGSGVFLLENESFDSEDDGAHYARVNAEILKCGGDFYKGSGTAAGLKAGYFLNLSGHFNQALNSRFLITKIKHKGHQTIKEETSIESEIELSESESYICDFECIFNASPDASSGNLSDSMQAKQEFRLVKKTTIPKISESLTGIIASPSSGFAAYMDQTGEYLVDFINIPVIGSARNISFRLSTPYAGNNYGIHFPLPPGTEVLISFVNGCGDYAVIGASLNNSSSPSLSNENNNLDHFIKTPLGNRISLSDNPESRGITLAVPSVENNSLYDFVQTLKPSGESEKSAWFDVVTGNKFSNFIGSEFSFNIGQESSISASLSSGVSLSSAYEMSAGLSAEIDLGNYGVSWSPKIPGLNSFGKYSSLEIGDGGDKFSFGFDKEIIETENRYEVKTAAIENFVDKKYLETVENGLKRLVSALLGVDIAMAYAMKQVPAIYKNKKISEIEDKYQSKYKEALRNYEDRINSKEYEHKKLDVLRDFESKKNEASRIRIKELEEVDKSFDFDNGWKERGVSLMARGGLRAASLAVLLRNLQSYAKVLSEHKNKIKTYKSSLLMDEKNVEIYQKNPQLDGSFNTNELKMCSEAMEVNRVMGKWGKMSILFNKDGINIKEKKFEKEIELHINAGKNIFCVKTGKYIVNISNEKMILGKKDGHSTIKISDDEIFLNSKTVHIDNKTKYSKNITDLFKGSIYIFE